MGRAIVRHPQAFLLDERLSNLDAKLRVEMRAEMARPHDELAVTSVYATDDQVEAMTIGTRVAALGDCRCSRSTAPAPLRQPLNLSVDTFIGAPAMNLFSGAVGAAEPAAAPAGAAGGGLALRIGQHRLVLDAATVAAHPGLPGMVGRPVVVGVRREGLANVALDPAFPRTG
jgi:multiple sugar transport system ATP-binding protein